MSAPDQRSEAVIAAFNEGYAAYEEGDEVWQNAYSDADAAERELAEAWREGWLKAAEDYVREAESNEQDKVLDDPRHTPYGSRNSG